MSKPALTIEVPPPPPALVADSVPSNEESFFPDSSDSLLTQNDAVVEDVKKLSYFMALLIDTSDAEALDKYNIRISKQMKKVIQALLLVRTSVNSTVFDNIEGIFREIIADNKIDAKDVPKVMLLIAELYKISHKTEFKFDEKACGDVLKIMFLVATKEKLIPISDEDMQLLTCLYEIIDTSVRLTQAKDGDLASAPGLFSCLYERLTGCIRSSMKK